MRLGLRTRILVSLCVGLLTCGQAVCALNIGSRYSPRNSERPRRTRTDYIILHTTEGPAKGSLKKVTQRGEAHYFVDTDGRVLRIIHKSRVAFHAGRSMWNGRTNLDTCSIGIEVVGYHNRSITGAQYAALRELLNQLQRIYSIPDARVLTHSMVAYGAPNRWHKRSHRGRKRCGMLFARESVRRRLGLTDRPALDPDVAGGRLVVADPELERVLYAPTDAQASARVDSGGDVIGPGRSAWDIARDRYRSGEVEYVFPDGRRLRGNEIRDWKRIPAGTRVIDTGLRSDNADERVYRIGRDGDTAWDIAGDEYAAATTVYFLPDGRVATGDRLGRDLLDNLPRGTQVLVGYMNGGRITAGRSAFDICGERWHGGATFYRFPDGRIVAGDAVDERAIPEGTLVFLRN